MNTTYLAVRNYACALLTYRFGHTPIHLVLHDISSKTVQHTEQITRLRGSYAVDFIHGTVMLLAVYREAHLLHGQLERHAWTVLDRLQRETSCSALAGLA